MRIGRLHTHCPGARTCGPPPAALWRRGGDCEAARGRPRPGTRARQRARRLVPAPAKDCSTLQVLRSDGALRTGSLWPYEHTGIQSVWRRWMHSQHHGAGMRAPRCAMRKRDARASAAGHPAALAAERARVMCDPTRPYPDVPRQGGPRPTWRSCAAAATACPAACAWWRSARCCSGAATTRSWSPSLRSATCRTSPIAGAAACRPARRCGCAGKLCKTFVRALELCLVQNVLLGAFV